MGDGLALGEINQAFNARLKGREILDVEPPWVQGVTGEQNAGVAIVESNADFAVAGNGDDVDDASAQVNLPNVGRPIPDAEEIPGGFNLGRNERDGDGGIVERLHPLVSPRMISMLVSMGDDERDASAAIALEPVVDDKLQSGRQVAIARASIGKQGFVLAEQEEDKGLLIIGAGRLAQDDEVRVVLMHLPLRNLHALGILRVPVGGKRTALEVAAVGLEELR